VSYPKKLNLNSQDISLVVDPSGHKLSLEGMGYLMAVITKDNFNYLIYLQL